ncbi:hypothetical protein [Chitiniphilus eburneus]|uniref:hypothetical protein n=1 Tax=Chitiniphilus eburneus TaxID=2571148 RepID=UPI0035D04285
MFLDFVVPTLICMSLFGELTYVCLARLLYEHVSRHYADMLPEPINGEDRDVFTFLRSQREWYVSGHYERVQERWWQRIFRLNRVVGWLTVGSILLLFLGFMKLLPF